MTKPLYMDGTKLNRHLEEVVKWRHGEWIVPIHMEISISNICNQKCTFCYIDWSHGHINMAESTLVDLIRSAKSVGVKSALIAGEGEPTLNKAYVPAIEAAGEVGLDIALNTNAVPFTNDKLERILPHLSWMRCSVQAASRDLYSSIHKSSSKDFDLMRRNIATAVDIKYKRGLKVSIGIQQVLLKENAADSANVARMAKELGVDYYVVKPCHPHEFNVYEHAENLAETYADVLREAESLSDGKFKAIVRWNFLAALKRTYDKCLALPFIVQITANGDVATCYPLANKPEHIYGNLNEQSFAEIVKADKFKDVWSAARDNVDVQRCMPTCRQHNANTYLWWLTEEEPDHINFI